MAKKTAEDLVNDPKVQKYINNIDTDAQAAIDLANSVIGSPTGKLYSSKTLSTYKADVTRLDKSWGEFNAAWNKVVFGKAKSSKDIIKTYSKYVLALEVLEQANARHEAMMTSGFALAAAALLNGMIEWAKSLKDRAKKLEAELIALQKLIKKAEIDVIGAHAQLGLNVALTAVTFCLGPVGWVARIGIAVGSIGTHMVIDAALGPSKGSAIGSINTVAGESVELVDKLSKGTKRMAGGAAAVVTLKMDVDEIGDAEKIVKEIQKRIKAAEKEWRSLTISAMTWNKRLSKLKKAFDNALKVYEASAKKFKSSQRKREEVLKEFKQWK